jgi:hypothetical protein
VRGFVGPLTWAFFGEDINAIPDDELVTAYMGWLWLFPAIQSDRVLTDFQTMEVHKLTAQLMSGGIENLKVRDRFRIGGSDLFEFIGTVDGKPIRGAGNVEATVTFTEDMPLYRLPAIYSLIGRMQAG